jgi:ribosomal protein S27AE
MTASVGEDIEDICTRCGDTWHVVMAKVGERIAKVVCKRCGSQHNFRSGAIDAPAAATEGGRPRSGPGNSMRRRSTRSQVPVAAEPPPFDPDKPPRPYSARDAYMAGERITHPSFGSGVVVTAPGPGKVEVVFPSGPRVLACAKEGSTLERPKPAAHVPIADRPPQGDK